MSQESNSEEFNEIKAAFEKKAAEAIERFDALACGLKTVRDFLERGGYVAASKQVSPTEYLLTWVGEVGLCSIRLFIDDDGELDVKYSCD